MNIENTNVRVFFSLEERLSALEPKDAFRMGRDRWLLAIIGAGVVLTLPSILGAGASGAWLSIIGVVVELCALAVFTFRQLRDVVPEFVDAKRKFADELDLHFLGYEELRDWLRTIPDDVRGKRLAYVESRLESMGQRYSIVFGAIDRLGVLPVLAGVFLQLLAIENVSKPMGILGLLVIALYCMGLWMERFRLQLLAYARLLRSVN